MEKCLGPWEGRDRAVEREYVSVDSRDKKSLNVFEERGQRTRGSEWSYMFGIIQTRKDGLLVSWAGREKGRGVEAGGKKEGRKETGGCCFR